MSPRKQFLVGLGIPFVIIQAYWTLAPKTGIVARYGFLRAFPKFFKLNWGNALLMAGLTDFMAVIAIAFVWMYNETPPERRWTPKFFVWAISYVVFPGLGFLLFFLWLNPDHRFVADDEALVAA